MSAKRRATPTGDVRVATVRLLARLDREGGSLTRLLPPVLEALAPAERPRCQAWCYGVARRGPELAALRATLVSKPLKAKDADVARLIDLGLFRLLHTDAPAHGVVDSTVAAAELLGKGWAKGFVNALLRRTIREREALLAGLDAAAASAHPAWLHERFGDDWGHERDAILAANNAQAPMTLRVGATGPDAREAARDALAGAGIEASPGNLSPVALRLATPVPVTRLPGFDRGATSVQDEAGQLATLLLARAAPRGARLLDACAAPGGKTAHALETGRFGDIVALDVDATRLERVAETLARIGAAPGRVDLRAVDAADVDLWWDGRPFDAVLLDAPCSGTGVIRRHPDIKLLRRASDIEPLVAAQARLLDALWRVLAPGGHLLYATCSILKDENERQLARFLERTPDARALPPALPLDPSPDSPPGPPPGRERPGGYQILPGEGDADGFWYSLLRRDAPASSPARADPDAS